MILLVKIRKDMQLFLESRLRIVFFMIDTAVEGLTNHASLIIPPPELRKIIDKTSDFVARNGFGFEERIREKENDNPKFNFLNPNDPYHDYYQVMISENKSKKDTKQPPKDDETKEKTDVKKQLAPPKPAPFEFLVELPSITHQDLKILHLTALYAARRYNTASQTNQGSNNQFLQNLAQREQKNAQFEFLRPSHSLYKFFQQLVDQYQQIFLKTFPARIDELSDRKNIMERIMKRVKYESFMQDQVQRQQREADEERLAFATIDWHDFIVVESIEFTTADDAVALPPPMSIMELESMTLEQRKSLVNFGVQPAADGNVVETARNVPMEVDMEIEMEEPNSPTNAQEPIPVKQNQLPISTGPTLTTNIRENYVPKRMDIF